MSAAFIDKLVSEIISSEMEAVQVPEETKHNEESNPPDNRDLPIQQQEDNGPVWTMAFGLSLLALLLMSFASSGSLAFALPIAFLPTLLFLLWWYFGASRELIGFHSLVFAYASAFYVGSVLVSFFENVVEVFIILLFQPKLSNQNGFLTAYFFYVLFGEALGSEGVKFIIAKEGRRYREDLTNVSAYLMYSTAAALGFVTFLTVLQNFIATSLKNSLVIYDDYPLLLIRALLGIPLHTATGYFIGIFVAKNEVYQWNTPWYKILSLPVILRTIVEYVFVLCWYKSSFFDFISGPSWLPGLIVSIVVLALLISIIRYHERDLPTSFGALSGNEDEPFPVPDTLGDIEMPEFES